MIKLCIFDLDGTLIDSAPDLEASANFALKHYGLPQRSLAQIKSNMGKGVNHLLKVSIPKEKHSEQLLSDIKAMYVEHYANHCTDFTIVYEGVLDMLRILQQRGVMLSIFTNKPHSFLSKIIVDMFDGIEFTHVIGQGQGKYPDKPDPSAVFAIMKELNITPEECIYVGDTEVDIQTGANAGIQTIGVSWGYRSAKELEEAGAEPVIDRAAQLIDLIAELDAPA